LNILHIFVAIFPNTQNSLKNYKNKLLPTTDSEISPIEESLRKSLKETSDYKYALDESSIVAITDQKGIIKYVNNNFCKISKYSAEELIGQDHRIINSGHHSKEFIKNLWGTIANGKIWRGELKNKAKDGTFYWVDTTIVPFLNEIGKPYQYVAIRADITMRKEAEQENQRLKEQLEDRVKERTEELEAFSYSISHDLRAPLRAVNGYAKMLEEDYTAVFDDEGKRLLNVIQENAKRMGLLIDDLLAFSRLGRKEISHSFINMNELAESIWLDLSRSTNTKAEIKINKLHTVIGDRPLISQVFVNLLSNANKYSSKTEQPRIEISSHTKNGEIIYSIKDNGVGFENEYVHKLFGVFQRLHSYEEFEGTGVGLALVKRIISKHGGRVWAEGEVNKGATFYFSLPADHQLKEHTHGKRQ
jgi:PAS domain S-box-containing protein